VSEGRVLVIEDDIAIANLLRRGLGLKGIEVTITRDGSAGREAWGSGDFGHYRDDAGGEQRDHPARLPEQSGERRTDRLAEALGCP
jgi:hypothetical protein